MATLGIRIVFANNNSTVGHMYVAFKGDDGSVTTFGMYPGGVRDTDLGAHENRPGPPGTNGAPDVSRDFFLSPTDYQKALDYAINAQSQAGQPFKTWGDYDPLTRSCVDFTWNVMREAGLSSSSWFEGYPLPSWNKDPLSDAYFDFYRRPEFNREGTKGINSTVNTATTAAINWVLPRRDPLVLDLDGGGISTSGINPNAPILFDQDGDGTLTATGWIASGEAIVVRDLNGNGRIDSGRELFGDNTVLTRGPNAGQLASNGFAALADLDADALGVADGKFDSNDAAFASVRLWKDANQNGVSEAGELFSFSVLGVQSINVTALASNVNLGGGNTQTFTGSFNRVGGVVGDAGTAELAGSLLLANNNFYRQFTDDPVVTPTAQALPQMTGSGWVRDLREAMSLGTAAALELQAKVSAFAVATTKAGQMALLDEVIAAWGKTATRQGTGVAGSYANFDHNFFINGYGAEGPADLGSVFGAALDALGFNWRGVSAGNSARGEILGQMLVDAGLVKGYVVRAGPTSPSRDLYTWTVSVDEAFAQSDPVRAAEIRALEAFNGQRLLDRFVNTVSGEIWGGTALVMSRQIGTSVAQTGFLNQAYGALKEGIYSALVEQTRLKPYLDSIELRIDANGVQFDLAAANALVASKAATDPLNVLVDLIDLKNYAGDSIAAVGWDIYKSMYAALATTPITVEIAALLATQKTAGLGVGDANYVVTDARGLTVIGNDSNNTLTGGAGVDTLYGYGGNDVLWANGDGDALFGGAGDDTLGVKFRDYYSGVSFTGGEGNDVIVGARASNTYNFNQGDGQDTISNYSVYRSDVIKFGNGIAASDITVVRAGENLVFRHANNTDQITVTDWFIDSFRWIERVEFANGTVWNASALTAAALVVDGTAGNDVMTGTPMGDTLSGLTGNDTLTGFAGNDRLYGMEGTDSLDGGYGDDLLDGGEGSDVLWDYSGSNFLAGGAGDDTMGVESATSNNVFVGGRGNDTLTGSYHSDEYRFNLGDGSDTIFEGGAYGQLVDPDKLVFGADISSSDVFAARSGADLIFRHANGTDKVAVHNWFQNTAAQLETIEFADGTIWHSASVTAGLLTFTGTEINDVMYASPLGGDTLLGLGGNDTLISDGLSSTLVGGIGNDVLIGNGYNVTYKFNVGDGQDAIQNTTDSGYTSSLLFGVGIATTDISVARSGLDMVFSHGNGVDLVYVQDWFSNSAHQISRVEFADGTVWAGSALTASALTVTGTADADVLLGTGLNDILRGLGGDDYLTGGDGVNVLDGGYGDDEIYGNVDYTSPDYGNGGWFNNTLLGGAGNDFLHVDTFRTSGNVFAGGAGDDVLYGSVWDDIFQFNLGDGQDRIRQDVISSLGAATDKLMFGAGIAPSDIYATPDGNDLVFRHTNGTDQILVQSWFYDVFNRLGTVEFADGTVWNRTSVNAGLSNVSGTGGDDLIVGTPLDDVLRGMGGADTIYGHGGSNVLDGGAGNDVLFGNTQIDIASSDILIGGAGNDLLNGGWGTNSYRFEVGDGSDIIVDVSYSSTLAFGAGIAPSDIAVKRNGLDVVFAHANGSDRVTVRDWFGGSDRARIDLVQFADGTVWNGIDLSWAALTVIGTGGDDLLIGTAYDDTLRGMGGNDVLNGGYGTNTLEGGDGDDLLFGITDPNDYSINMMLGGAGNDTYVIAGSADTAVENANEGIDTVQTGITWALSSNVENLTLTGTAAINATGNEQDNVLTGNTAANILTGGAGNDTYVVGAGDTTIEVAGGGIDTVQSAITWTLAAVAEVENLTLTGTSTINATGNTLNNLLSGNSAANTLSGAAGDDKYIFNLGSGADRIIETTGADRIVFGAGITAAQVTATRTGSVVKLVVSATDSISIDQISSGVYAVEQFEFADGSVQSAAWLTALLPSAPPTATNLSAAETYTEDTAKNLVDIVVSDSDSATTTVSLTLSNAAAGSLNTGTSGAVTATYSAASGVWTASGVIASVNTLLAALTFTPTANFNGNFTVATSVSDGINTPVTGGKAFTGAKVNDAPTGVVTITGNAAQNQTLTASNTLADVDGLGAITYQWSAAGVAIAGATGAALVLGSAQIGKAITVAASYTDGGATAETKTSAATAAVMASFVGTVGADTLSGTAAADQMSGLAGNDTYVVNNVGDIVVENLSEGIDLVNASVSYTLAANVENITLTGTGAINATGNAGDNVLTGNSGANVLTGGAGNDTYVAGTGDTVVEALNGGIDTVQIGITHTLAANVENLTLTGTTAINGSGNGLDNVLTGNSAINVLTGGAGNDTYVVTAGDTTIEALNAGTDTVQSAVAWTLAANVENLTLTGTAAVNGSGNADANVLTGNSGANTLTGLAGNDTLDGKAGADSLVGGAGNDTYWLGRGYGIDTITETDATAGNTDMAKFEAGVATNQLWFRQVANNLEVSIIGASDKFNISNWYSGAANHVEQFKTSDGKPLLDSQVQNLVSAMAAFAPPAAGQTTLPANYATALAPVLAANWQ